MDGWIEGKSVVCLWKNKINEKRENFFRVFERVIDVSRAQGGLLVEA